jgi:hypothetical protein
VKRLTFPHLPATSLIGPVSSFDQSALDRVGARYASPPSTFGLELKVAYALEAAGHGGERLRRAYYRPAQEPILVSWWAALQLVPLDPGEMRALASILAGTEVRYRTGEMASQGAGEDGRDLLYETPSRSRTWPADIARADAAQGDTVKKALYRFARIVIAHPLSDGNGRLARAALQAGLAQGGLIATPCLAPAPVFCLRAAEIRAALAALSATGDWLGYFERMGGVLAECLATVDAVWPLSTHSAATD